MIASLSCPILLGECDLSFRAVVLEIDLGSGNALTSVLVADAMDLSVLLANLETPLSAFRDTD